MKKLYTLILLAALVLSACGTAANPDGYYNVTLTKGGVMTCNNILWTGDYLHCDNHWPIRRSNVWEVYFVAGVK